MNPDLEVVQIRRGESFKAWSHGYPFHTVRWHFHPEYEIHHVVATTGRYFVGDFIGEFEPGNLVLTGPNLPHNWVSDVPAGTSVPLRCRIIQFREEFIADAMTALPELAGCAAILEAQPPRRAVLRGRPAELAAPVLAELVEAQGVRRIELFMMIVGILSRAAGCADAGQRQLSARSLRLHVGRHQQGARLYQRQPDRAVQRERPGGDCRPAARARFRAAFRRHTGMSLVQYVNRLRINLACQMLMSDEPACRSPRSASRSATTISRISTGSSWRRKACRLRASGPCWRKTSARQMAA